MKKAMVIGVVLSSVLIANSVSAKSDHVFSLPTLAREVGPNVFSLGLAYDKQSDSFVEGMAIVHKKENAKSVAAKSKSPRSPACYALMADGAKWKVNEPWVVNPLNTFGLGDNFIFGTLTSVIGKWEEASDGVLNNSFGLDIMGNGETTINTLEADEVAPDNLNEVYFDSLESGTIAVTIVWGNFSGPMFNRRLVEWDQVYSTNYDWTDDGATNPTKMDFANIATHEVGHAFGLGDIYSPSCSEVTMYGYGTEGETKKQTLEAADILGISKLY